MDERALAALKLLLLLGAGGGYLGLLGYLPARLLLRGPLQSLRWVLLLPLGFCTLVVLSSFVNTLLLPMAAVTWVLGVAALAGVAAAVRTSGSWGLPRPSRSDVMVAALALGAYAIAGAPLVYAGDTVFLGIQWDLEIYLPLTEYLKAFTAGGGFPGPTNPLLEAANSLPVRAGSGLGFSYFDAALGTLTGQPSHATFRPALHLVFAFSVPSVYAFARGGLGTSAGVALLAAGLAACNGFNQWIAAIGLAGHGVTLGLLPLSMLGVLAALRRPSAVNLVLAALPIAAMLISFYTGALAVFGIAAAGAGVAHLLIPGRRRQVLLAGAATAALVAAFGLVAHLRFLELVPLYAQLGFSEGWHIVRFSPLSEPLGLSPFSLVVDGLNGDSYWGSAPAPPLALLVSGLTVAALAAAALAFTKPGWDRRSALGMVGALVAFGLVLRAGAGYHYGYFKLLSLSSFLLLALAAQGSGVAWGAAWRERDTLLAPALRAGLAAAAAAFLLTLTANTVQTARFFWEPAEQGLPRAVWELQGLREVLRPGAPVYVAGRPAFEPRTAAMVAYFLRDNPVMGNLKTAYGEVRSSRADEAYSYLLLNAGERPESRGLTPEDAVWRNDLVALYRRPARWISASDFEVAGRAVPIERGDYTVELTQGGWNLAGGGANLSGRLDAAPRAPQFELTLLTFGSTGATVRQGSSAERMDLPPGLGTLRTPTGAGSGRTVLQLDPGGRPAWLLGFRVVEAGGLAPGVQPGRELLLLQSSAEAAGGTAALKVHYALDDLKDGDIALSVEVYRRSGGARALDPVAAWQLARDQGTGSGQLDFRFDPASWRCGTAGGNLNAPGPPPEDGDYEAHLAVYYVGQEVHRWPWLQFSRRAGQTDLRAAGDAAYQVVNLTVPDGVRALAAAVPPNALVALPAPVDPDSAFIAVAGNVLRGRLVAATRAGDGGLVLLPKREPAAVWGLTGAQVLWENGQAVLYRSPGYQAPSAAGRGTGISLNAGARLEGASGVVDVRWDGPAGDRTVLGLDVYGERACGLDHFGWWAAPAGALPPGFAFNIDLARQRGALIGTGGVSLPADFRTWPVSDGRFRAFLFVKQGETFDTVPVFEFTLDGGRATGFRSLPVRHRIPLR